MIHEKQKIQDVFRQSQTSFMKQKDTSEEAVPTISRRLGGGLAAVVKSKVVQKSKTNNMVADDDSYYDEEEDLSEEDDHVDSSSRPSTSKSINHFELLR